MEYLSDQLNKCTSDKHIYKFLFKIRANFINNAADIDKLLKQKFVGHLATVLSKRVEKNFQSEENNKIIDVLLSILANCTYNNKTATNQVYDANIIESLMTIINKSENGILMAKTCRLLGNLVQKNEKLGISFEQAGAALSLSNCLSEKSISMLSTMSLRALRLMWISRRKFRFEILSLGTIFKIISCLRNTLKSEFKKDANEVEAVPSNMVILKRDSEPDRLISKQKLSSILTKMETQNVETKYEILRTEKNNYEFAIPTSKDNIELITGLLKLLLTVTGTSSLLTQIAKNVYADGLGIECLLYLIEESPKFRGSALKILSNLSFSSNSQEYLGINNELIPTISSLLMKYETLELNEQRNCLEILCLSTENSCNRLKLKRSGVFKILLSIASNSKIREELNLLIFAFFQYRYDEDSLNLLIQLNLINVLMKVINDIIENKKVDHIKVDDSDKDRKDEQKTKHQRKRISTEPLQFGGYTKFMRFESNSPSSSGYGSYQYSPSRSSSDGFSPYNSPQRCYQDYNSDSNEYSPVCSDNEENSETSKKQDKDFDILDFIYNNDEIGRYEVNEQQKDIGEIEDETTSLTLNDHDSDDESGTKMEIHQSSSSKNLPETLKSIEADNLQYVLLLLWKVSINHNDALAFTNIKNLSILIRVYGLVKKPHEKIYQILQNILEQTRNFVPIFIRQDFVFQIYDTANTDFNHLKCYSCDKMKVTGFQLLKDFRKVAEGGYGQGQIADILLQDQIELKRKVATKLIYVISSPEILNKFLFNFGALDIIMDTIYSNDEVLSVAACNGITILSNNLNIRIPSEDDVFQRIIPDEFELENSEKEDSSNEQVKFILKDGDALFDKDLLMASSEVFNSMFSGDFRESNKNEVKFPNYTVLGMKYFFQLVKMSKENKLKPIAPKIDNMDVVLQAYELSILYIMTDIQQPLLNIIKVILDETNVKRIFEWSIRNINQDLLISSICYYLCGAIDGKTKLKLYLEVKESQYSKEFKDLIFDCILMKCKPIDD
ncbi:unnamed protein product [Chironomus riparius]|uniref:BTB domain-containing protein n=1 Tax=Chironomus riparius TaxID=315576 RepID=A0A9N9S2K0_9DIPT|nr:unnamed protein product [Chironomus riparius]